MKPVKALSHQKLLSLGFKSSGMLYTKKVAEKSHFSYYLNIQLGEPLTGTIRSGKERNNDKIQLNQWLQALRFRGVPQYFQVSNYIEQLQEQGVITL